MGVARIDLTIGPGILSVSNEPYSNEPWVTEHGRAEAKTESDEMAWDGSGDCGLLGLQPRV